MSPFFAKQLLRLLALVTLLILPGATRGQNLPTISTIAGGGPVDNGSATSSALGFPANIAVDPGGNLFISDDGHQLIRKVDANGVITTVAGNGIAGFSGDGGLATSAEISSPGGLAADSHGNLFFSDVANNRVRKVDANGIITTVAGNGIAGFSGDGGTATQAEINSPGYLAVDSSGNLFIGDVRNFRVRRVDASGVIATVAGNGVSGFSGDGGPAINASFSFLAGLAIDGAGSIFIADGGNARVREVNTSGNINTIAGTGIFNSSGDGGPATQAGIDGPAGLALDATGNLLIVDETGEKIRKVDTQGIINTVAGTGAINVFFTGDGGPATGATLNRPSDVALDSLGSFYIADGFNYRIRKVDTSGMISTVAGTGEPNFSGDGGLATNALLDTPSGVAADGAGNIYLSDTKNGRIRRINNLGIINTVVVEPNLEFFPALSPLGLFVDPLGNLFFSDISSDSFSSTPQVQELSNAGNLAILATLNGAGDVAVTSQGIWAISDNCIQKIAAGTGTTVAGVCGTQTRLFGGDGGPATSAFINFPRGLAVDSTGNIFIADTLDNRIRKVDISGMINTIAGNGAQAFSGDGGPAAGASLNAPGGLRLSQGNIFFADTANNRIRKIDPRGTISTIAGNGTAGFSGDGGPAANASLNAPVAVAIDATGNLLITDTGNNRIRKVTLPNFAIVSSPSGASVKAGQSATFTVSIVPQNGFTGSIVFACSGLPALASCSFTPPQVTPNGAQVSATLQIMTSGPNAALHAPQLPFRPGTHHASLALWSGGFLGLAGLLLAGKRNLTDKDHKCVIAFCAGAILVALLLGCSGGNSMVGSPTPTPPVAATPAGTSVVVVTATSSDGSIANIASINLTVAP